MTGMSTLLVPLFSILSAGKIQADTGSNRRHLSHVLWAGLELERITGCASPRWQGARALAFGRDFVEEPAGPVPDHEP